MIGLILEVKSKIKIGLLKQVIDWSLRELEDNY